MTSDPVSIPVVTATWYLELNCHCPECKEFVDLLEADGFWDDRGTSLNVLEHGTPRTKAVEVVCPKCDHEFEVRTEY
jgi:phage FluMu protein Com